jgi:phage tail protein X
MRVLLGLAVLLSLFVMAASWQGRWTDGIRRARDTEHGAPDQTAVSDAGWTTLVIGLPSGAEPVAPVHVETDVPEAVPEELAEPVGFVGDFEYTVRPGDVLGRICDAHYSTAAKNVVAAVAAYNGLSSPDQIRVGQVLALPDRSRLTAASNR